MIKAIARSFRYLNIKYKSFSRFILIPPNFYLKVVVWEIWA